MDGTWKEKQYDYKNNKWNVIKCDIIRGFNYNRYRYVICIFLVFAFIALFNVEMHNKTNVFPGFLDNVFYILRGFQVLGDSENDLFLFPYVWITIQFMCCFVTFDYISKDKKNVGIYYLVMSGDKNLWWFSKCIWNMLSVLAVYIIIWVLSAIIAVLGGGFKNEIDYNMFIIPRYKPDYGYSWKMLLVMIVLPLIYSVMISLVQMVISECIFPILGIAVVMLIDILSVYFVSVGMLGNISMIIRTDAYRADGISVVAGIVISMIIYIAALFIGRRICLKDDYV